MSHWCTASSGSIYKEPANYFPEVLQRISRISFFSFSLSLVLSHLYNIMGCYLYPTRPHCLKPSTSAAARLALYCVWALFLNTSARECVQEMGMIWFDRSILETWEIVVCSGTFTHDLTRRCWLRYHSACWGSFYFVLYMFLLLYNYIIIIIIIIICINLGRTCEPHDLNSSSYWLKQIP